jgi:hypothetical protein
MKKAGDAMLMNPALSENFFAVMAIRVPDPA